MRLCLSGPSATQEHPIKVSAHNLAGYGIRIDLNADGVQSDSPRPASFPLPFWSIIFHYGRWAGKILPRYFHIVRYIGPDKEALRVCIALNIEFRRFDETACEECEEWEAHATAWILTALQNKKGVIWNALQKSIVPGDQTSLHIIERMSDVAGYIIKNILHNSECNMYSTLHTVMCNVWHKCGFKLSCSTYDHVRDHTDHLNSQGIPRRLHGVPCVIRLSLSYIIRLSSMGSPCCSKGSHGDSMVFSCVIRDPTSSLPPSIHHE